MQIQKSQNVSFGATPVLEGAPRGTIKALTEVLQRGPKDIISVANFNAREGFIRVASVKDTPQGIVPINEAFIPRRGKNYLVGDVAAFIRKTVGV